MPFTIIDKFQISRDSQALYLTIVAKDRLPVFRTDAVKRVTCDALNEACTSAAFLIFAYVIMTEHIRIITSQRRSSAEVLRYVKGITGRRVIDYLKQSRFVMPLRGAPFHNCCKTARLDLSAPRRRPRTKGPRADSRHTRNKK